MAKRPPKAERRTAVRLVEDRIRKSGLKPGFDYAKTVLELRDKFANEDIAEACAVSKNTVSQWLVGHMPAHDSGERLYILWMETFNKEGTPDCDEDKKPPMVKLPN